MQSSPIRMFALASLAAACATSPAPIEHRAPPATAVARGPAPIDMRGSSDLIQPASVITSTPVPVVREDVAAPIAPGARPETIVVQSGDTLYSVSERYMVSLRTLIDANKLDAPFRLRAGERLQLPPPNTYSVQPGDTLYGVARRHRVQFRSLALLNGIKEPFDIAPGQEIVLPGAARDWEAAAAPVKTADLGASGAASPGPRTLETPRPARGADPVGPAPQFIWPHAGDVVSTFGPKGPGRRNDGVNIEAASGADVRATADGLVVYAGEELAGYGKLVLIKHADGWVSAYAHNSELLVAEEQSIKQGEVIAKAGSTGAVDTAQLHFELRKSGRPVDPLTVIPKSG